MKDPLTGAIERQGKTTIKSKGFPLSRSDWEAQGRPNWRLISPDGEDVEICKVQGCRYFIVEFFKLPAGTYTLRAGTLRERVCVYMRSEEKKCL